VIPLTLPPLRERRRDLDLLIEHFLGAAGAAAGGGISTEARQWLLDRPWRGNVRELQNVIERAVLLSRGRPIERGDLEGAGTVARPPATAGLAGLAGLTIAEMERRLILETLRLTNNNRTRAAQQLGISIRTLRNKLAEYRAGGWLAREPRPQGAAAEAADTGAGRAGVELGPA
jgi:two-component system response regulator FlrC